MANERVLFEVITSLCKLGQRCELAVSLVFFLSHSPQSMPSLQHDSAEHLLNVLCPSCVHEICVLITVFMVLGLLTVMFTD